MSMIQPRFAASVNVSAYQAEKFTEQDLQNMASLSKGGDDSFLSTVSALQDGIDPVKVEAKFWPGDVAELTTTSYTQGFCSFVKQAGENMADFLSLVKMALLNHVDEALPELEALDKRDKAVAGFIQEMKDKMLAGQQIGVKKVPSRITDPAALEELQPQAVRVYAGGSEYHLEKHAQLGQGHEYELFRMDAYPDVPSLKMQWTQHKFGEAYGGLVYTDSQGHQFKDDASPAMLGFVQEMAGVIKKLNAAGVFDVPE